MPLDTSRHDDLFNKTKFTQDIHVIGLGGVGSHVVRQLAKLGAGTANDVYGWDGDKVDPHNLPNQAYVTSHVGQKKAHALAERYFEWSSENMMNARPYNVTERIPLSGVVFLCVDDMGVRKTICETSIWRNPDVSVLIETRMDASHVVVFLVDPNNDEHVRHWNTFWYPKSETENEAGCGGHITVITAVEITASFAVQQFIDYARASSVRGLPNLLELSLRKWTLNTYRW